VPAVLILIIHLLINTIDFPDHVSHMQTTSYLHKYNCTLNACFGVLPLLVNSTHEEQGCGCNRHAAARCVLDMSLGKMLERQYPEKLVRVYKKMSNYSSVAVKACCVNVGYVWLPVALAIWLY